MTRLNRLIRAMDTRCAERRLLPILMAFAAGVLVHDLAAETDTAQLAERADAAEIQLTAARAALARLDADQDGGIIYAEAALLCPQIAALGDRHD